MNPNHSQRIEFIYYFCLSIVQLLKLNRMRWTAASSFSSARVRAGSRAAANNAAGTTASPPASAASGTAMAATVAALPAAPPPPVAWKGGFLP